MTRRVVSVRPDSTIADAARLMMTAHISGLPVLTARGKLVGIVTEGDLLRRAESGTQRRRPRWLEFLLGPGRLADEYVRSHARRIEEVMTRKVVTATPATPLEEAVGLMERHRVKRLPVVDGGRVVGIVARANLLRALIRLAPETAAGPRSDRTIRERIAAEIDRQPWNPGGLANVVVRNGVVDLWGTIFDERERTALRVAAENVPGVKAVHDHLIWMEPVSGTTMMPPAAEAPKARGPGRRQPKRAAARAK
jgi:CBS domain-containing protein